MVEHRNGKFDGSAAAVRAFAAFFAFLPFSYALQVTTKSSYAPLPGYLLLLGAMAWLLKSPHDSLRISRPDALSAGFLFLIIHHSVMCWFVAGPGDAGLVARVLLLFTVPLLVFWVPRIVNLDALELIFRFITVAALLVSIELIYENVCTQVFETSSYFQLLNKTYLHKVLGAGELGQLWWHAYRAVGLIEHPHATALFCNIGMSTAAIFYIFRHRLIYLAVALVSAGAVWTQGFRLPVLSQTAVIMLLCVFVWLEGDKAIRRRAAIFMSLYALTLACILIVDPTEVVHRYYLPGVQGDFQIPNNMGVGRWYRHTSDDLIRQSYLVRWLEGDSNYWRLALFGHGVLGTLSGQYPFSDDLFLLALPLQYGILGAIVFGGIWIATIWTGCESHFRQHVRVSSQLKTVAFAGLFAVLLMALSMTHSGVLQRKAIYPLFPFFIGVLARTRREYLDLRERACKPHTADISGHLTPK